MVEEQIINQIIKQAVKKVVIAQRLGIYKTLSEVVDFILQELDKQGYIVNEQEKDYIKNKVIEGLKFKLKQAN